MIQPVRTFLGSLVAALALAAAVYLHSSYRHSVAINLGPANYFTGSGGTAIVQRKYVWQDPLAIFLAVAGVGAGAGIVLRR